MAFCSSSSGDLSDSERFKQISHILTCIEIPIHIYGAWCIIFKTSKTMRPVKIFLLWSHCLGALLDLLLSFFTIPYLLLPTFSGYSLGLVDSPQLEIYVTLTTVAFLVTSILSIYENRYYVLFGSKNQWWTRIRKPYLAMNYGLAACFSATFFVLTPNQDIGYQKVAESLPCTPEVFIDDRHIFIAAVDFALPSFCVSFETLFLAFQIVLFFILTLSNIVKQDSKTNCSISKKTQNLQKKFMFALVIQSSVPIFLVLFPVLYALGSLVFGYHNQSIMNLCVLIVGSHGILATTVMILIHQPYRTATFQLFSCCKKRKVNSRVGEFKKPSNSSVNRLVRI